jgi:arginine/lysine/ornithine decarboxylase
MPKKPLIEEVNKHIYKNSISFHVPGHKNGHVYEGTTEFKNFLKNDLTELTNLDDLHHSEGVIAEAEAKLTNLYGSIQSFFLVGGSTVGNLTMILATLNRNRKVLVQRNCHKSVFNGLKLINAKPIFIAPEISEHLGVAGGLSLESVKAAIHQNPEAKVMILTYPNYYGEIYDIRKIIDFAHGKGIIVLVDEAHGAHFQLGNPFPTSALKYGADIVVQSAHKTLPAMTMGSWIHVNSSRVSIKKIKEYLEILQSSSPSYPIMMSLDGARSYLEEFTANDIKYTITEIKRFKTMLLKIEGLKLVETEDPLKLVIQVKGGCNGKIFQEVLETHGVFPEMSDQKNILFILPLLKSSMAYPFEEATNAIKQSIEKVSHLKNENRKVQLHENKSCTTLEISYSEMDSYKEEYISINKAMNKVSAETITPYPPGIPIIIRGEKITNTLIDLLNLCIENNIKIQGGKYLSNKQIAVLV